MVAAFVLDSPLRLLHRIAFAASPAGNGLRSIHSDVVLSMSLRFTRDLPLSGSFSSHSITAAHRPRSPQLPSNTCAAMATKSDIPAEDVSVREKKMEDDEERLNKKASLPPPPEKPEPGDCCGSGCVRCVWDVYYEELDEYNKLCESISEQSKSD